MRKKTALITGATSGFGTVIARHLIEKGHDLIIFGRSENKLDALISELKLISNDCKIEGVICDLSSFHSLDSACENVKKNFSEIDVLILNAGVWNFEFVETEDKVEETFQVNLLAPFFILQQLSNCIPKNDQSKAIFTASGLHQGNVLFSDIEFRNNFSGFKAYRQSKLGVILLTRLYAKNPEFKGITFSSVHPGVVNTELGRNAGWFSKLVFKIIGKSQEKGAQTHKHLIDQPATNIKTGEYYANSKITKTTSESNDLNLAAKLNETVNNYISKLHQA